jgi:protein-disulfide isomerase
MTATEKAFFSRLVTSRLSPCGEPITVATCVIEKRACAKCLPAAQAIAFLVTKGEDGHAIREWLDDRFEAKNVKIVPAGSSPTIGPKTAPLEIVEFVDFECPHCAAATPVVKKIVTDPAFAKVARLVVKNFPLTSHEHALDAAHAAIAADVQGKFFPYEELLFTHQDKLEAADLVAYAKTAGLDVGKFTRDQKAPTTIARVEADQKLGNDLGVDAVPRIFINGRRFRSMGGQELEPQLRAWLKLELQLAGLAAPGAGE